MRLPRILTPHTVTCRDLLGAGSMGDIYADPRTLAHVRVEETTQQVRSATGEEVTSTAQVYHGPEHPRVPVGSLVTLPSGREAEVLSVAHLHTPPAPEHYVVNLT